MPMQNLNVGFRNMIVVQAGSKSVSGAGSIALIDIRLRLLQAPAPRHLAARLRFHLLYLMIVYPVFREKSLS